jgi:hypothetical protein
VQLLNAPLPTLVTLLGIITLRIADPTNALFPMLVTGSPFGSDAGIIAGDAAYVNPVIEATPELSVYV